MTNENKTLIVAITGGIGSGKTTVAKIIEGFGHKVIYADVQAKYLMNNSSELREKIIIAFGHESYMPDGSVNKDFLSDHVFGSSEKHRKALIKLNSLVHPFVIDDMINQIEKYSSEGENLIFRESALIFETRIEKGFDYVIVVDSTEENCINRTMNRSGSTRHQVLDRMNEQIALSQKKGQADFVIENNGTLEQLEETTKFIYNIIKELPPKVLEDFSI